MTTYSAIRNELDAMCGRLADIHAVLSSTGLPGTPLGDREHADIMEAVGDAYAALGDAIDACDMLDCVGAG